MRIYSIANQKGGCGKTTTAINLSACLAGNGRKVLLIDMDPQSHCAMGLNIDSNDSDKTLCDILCQPEGSNDVLDDVVKDAGRNLDIAPSTISLSTFEQQLSRVNGRESRLKETIESMDGVYDYIIIDCPPSLGLLTFNALMASTEVIVPIEMSLFSLHGISRLKDIVELVREKTGHEIRIKVLATMFDRRTRISKEVLQDIKNHFKRSIFTSVIHANVKLKEAASFGRSIADYEKKARGYKDYLALSKEVIKEEKKRGIKPVKQKRPSSKKVQTKRKFQIYAPEAASVKIVGSFNSWEVCDAATMERNEDGTWLKDIDLNPGKYQYRFLVDDVWVEDRSNADSVDNPFGGKNSIIKIG